MDSYNDNTNIKYYRVNHCLFTKEVNGMITGGWNYLEMDACKLPEEVASGWTQVFNGHLGVEFIPALYCGSQVVNGTNHMIIAKAKTVTNPPREYMAKVILYVDLEGKFSLVSIDEIKP